MGPAREKECRRPVDQPETTDKADDLAPPAESVQDGPDRIDQTSEAMDEPTVSIKQMERREQQAQRPHPTSADGENEWRSTSQVGSKARNRVLTTSQQQGGRAPIEGHWVGSTPGQNLGLFDSSSDFIQQTNGVDWTADPNVQLVANMAELNSLLVRAKAEQSALKAPDGGALLRKLGAECKRLSGNVDFAFDEALPPAGTRVVLIRALCALRDKTLADGHDTLTGAFVDNFERVLGIPLIRTNTAMVCHRKGKYGVELDKGQAGCQDPKGRDLRALATVKELHFVGLLAAGLHIVAIIASSNASQLSFSPEQKGARQLMGTGTYEGVPIYSICHPKFVSPTCRFTKPLAKTLGAPYGDPLAVTSRVVDQWATIADEITSELGVSRHKQIYESLRANPPVVAREYSARFETTTTPDVQAKLEQAVAIGNGNFAAIDASDLPPEAKQAKKEKKSAIGKKSGAHPTPPHPSPLTPHLTPLLPPRPSPHLSPPTPPHHPPHVHTCTECVTTSSHLQLVHSRS